MDVPENGNASPIGDFDTGNDDKPVGLRVFHILKQILHTVCHMVSYVWVLSRCFPIIFPLSYKDQLNNNQKSPHISTVPLQQPPEKKKKKKTFSRIAVGWYLLNLLHIFRFAISKNIYIDIYMYKYGIPISYSTIYIVCTNMEFQKISLYI